MTSIYEHHIGLGRKLDSFPFVPSFRLRSDTYLTGVSPPLMDRWGNFADDVAAFTNAGSTRPNLVADSGNMNGLDSCDFGTADRIDNSDAAIAEIGEGAFTVFGVIYNAGLGTSRHLYDNADALSGATYRQRLLIDSTQHLSFHKQDGGGTTAVTSTATVPTGTVFVALTHDGTTGLSYRINGTTEADTIGSVDLSGDLGVWRLGNRVGGGDAIGEMGEFGAVDRVITTAEMNDLHTYAQTRYGVSA